MYAQLKNKIYVSKRFSDKIIEKPLFEVILTLCLICNENLFTLYINTYYLHKM